MLLLPLPVVAWAVEWRVKPGSKFMVGACLLHLLFLVCTVSYNAQVSRVNLKARVLTDGSPAHSTTTALPNPHPPTHTPV
jgi:hypothetical protein